MRRAARRLVAGVACLAVAGCGGRGGGDPAAKVVTAPTAKPARTAPPDPLDDAGAIRALLANRATALAALDASAYAATAGGAQRARDRRAVKRAGRLAIERIRYVAHATRTAGDEATIAVRMSYGVRGIRRPFVTARRVTARKLVDGWRVTRDVPRREPLPWEVAAFKAARARHVVLLTPPGVPAGPLRAGLTAAYREIRRDLPSRAMPERVLVIGARDARQTERLSGRLGRGVLALANVSVSFEPGPSLEVRRVLGQRMIVVVSRFDALSPAEREMTLVHEMTHTALDPDMSGRIPPWLAEGVALYVSNDDRTAEARALAAGAGPSIRLRSLCRPRSIRRRNGVEQGAAYAISSAAAYAIVARHGIKGLFALYDAFDDARIPGRPGPALTDRVLRRTLGMSLAELDAIAAGL